MMPESPGETVERTELDSPLDPRFAATLDPRLAATVQAGPELGDEQTFARGALVGRYVIVERLGAGAMGVVYSAYDPELDRKVALKFLKSGARDSAARVRLLREAQAMAKLTHPNVVTVHDVGTLGEEVFVAMEFVRGVTLTRWLHERPRSWREVVTTFIAVGRGLAAAHSAGLVHRDLKPENVMMGLDDRVRVMDFGLARSSADEPREPRDPGDSASHPRAQALGLELTRTGSLVGTPPYMAPELWEGREADARSDQFAFCVALWEGVHGERPFRGATMMALMLAISQGAWTPASDPRRAPAWLRRVLVRGFAVDPAARWPTIDALLAALAGGHRRARWQIAATIFVASGALVVGGLSYRRHAAEAKLAARIAGCEHEGDAIDETWNAASRSEVRAAILATGLGYAPTTADKVEPWLDGQAEAWRTARTRACLAAEVDGTFDAQSLDKALWCLDDRRLEFSALVDELTRADGTVVRKAVTAAAGFAEVASCVDPDALRTQPIPPPHETRVGVDEVRAALSRVAALRVAGKFAAGLELLGPILERAEVRAWPPLLAAARRLEGVLLKGAGKYPEAEAASEAAYMTAARVGAWEVAVGAALDLVSVVGYEQARYSEGRTWAGHAEVVAAFTKDGLGLREATRLNSLGRIDYETSAYAEARVLFERALEIRTKALGPDHPEIAANLGNLASLHEATGDYAGAMTLHRRALTISENALGPGHPSVATCLNNLANVYSDTGDYTGAQALHERGLAIAEAALGPGHPDVANSLNNLATVHRAIGENARAKLLLARALEIQETALGPEHPEVARTLSNLANVEYMAGDYAAAEALHRRALAVWEKVVGPEHPNVAMTLNNLAAVYYIRGDLSGAQALYERALEIREKVLGPGHPDLAYSLGDLANIHVATGDRPGAQALYERALAIREKALGPDHPLLALTLTSVGVGHLMLGDHAAALPLLERAVAIFDARAGEQEEESNARFALANILVLTHGDRTRAIAEARKAADVFRAAGAAKAPDLAEVEAWLVANSPSR